jgi:hypothetical protein
MGYTPPPGITMGNPSYTIYLAGTLTKAINNTTGNIEYSAVNSDVAINGAISELTNGGTLFYLPGSYICHAQVATGQKAITMLGTAGGLGGTPTAAPVTRIRYHTDIGADYLIKLGVDGDDTVGPQIRNMLIDVIDNTDCLGGIYMRNVSHAVIDNVMVDDVYNVATPGYGINLEMVGGSAAYYNIFQNLQLRRCTTGIRFGAIANANTIIGGQITGRSAVATTGILIDGAGEIIVLGPCDMESHAHASGIGLHIVTTGYNSFFGLRGEGNMKDVVIDAGGGTGNNTFVGCDFYSAVGGWIPVTDNGNGRSHYFGNSGYRTANRGTSTGTGAQQTIAHGLGITPDNVTITATATGTTETSLTAASDATNIYPTVTNAKTYQWFAEFCP